MKVLAKVKGNTRMTMVIANGNTSFCQAIYPAAFVRTQDVSKAFEFYRYTKLRFRIPPQTRFETTEPSKTSSLEYVLAYVPELVTATPTTLTTGNLAGVTPCFMGMMGIANPNAGSGGSTTAICAAGDTTPRTWTIPKASLLSTPTKWFRVVGDSEDDFTVQGSVCIAVTDSAGANTVEFVSIMDYEVEFAGPAQSSVL